jgi:inhibitor of cysteine peptidase
VSDLTLGLQDGGREVPVRVGDRVLLQLPENPTTGYRWQGSFPDGLRVEADRNLQGEPVPGAAGLRVFTVKVDRPGDYPLSLARFQAWEGAASADERFTVTLRVR